MSPRSVTFSQLGFTSLTVVSAREDWHLQECAHAEHTKKNNSWGLMFNIWRKRWDSNSPMKIHEILDLPTPLSTFTLSIIPGTEFKLEFYKSKNITEIIHTHLSRLFED
jgi:hypothetical protein